MVRVIRPRDGSVGPFRYGAVRLALEKILLPQLDSRTRPCNFVELLPRIKHEPA